MKRGVFISTFLSVLFLFSCDNAQFVGDWEKQEAVWDGGAPLPYMPVEIKLNADYTYHLDGSYTEFPGPVTGTYDLVGDSIFFGPDSLERFKVITISSTELVIKRSFVVTSAFKSWFGVTITYQKQ